MLFNLFLTLPFVPFSLLHSLLILLIFLIFLDAHSRLLSSHCSATVDDASAHASSISVFIAFLLALPTSCTANARDHRRRGAIDDGATLDAGGSRTTWRIRLRRE